MKPKTLKCLKYKKGGVSSSKKNTEKKLDILFNEQDILKNKKIKILINNLCNDDDNEIYKYEGITFDKKNKQILILLAKKLNINNKNIEKYNENEICQLLQYHNLPGTKFYHPSKYYNNLISKKNNLIHNSFRPESFLKNIKNKLQTLTLENKLVYNSIFLNDNYISTHQKAKWMINGEKILKEMIQLQLEIRAVLDNNGSTVLSDLLTGKRRVKSTIFFSKLKSRQKKQLEDLYETLTYDIKQTKKYLISLDTVEVRKELKDIRQGIRDKNKEEREQKEHQWKREKRWEDYEDRYESSKSKLLKATDYISEKFNLHPNLENLAKYVIKS